MKSPPFHNTSKGHIPTALPKTGVFHTSPANNRSKAGALNQSMYFTKSSISIRLMESKVDMFRRGDLKSGSLRRGEFPEHATGMNTSTIRSNRPRIINPFILSNPMPVMLHVIELTRLKLDIKPIRHNYTETVADLFNRSSIKFMYNGRPIKMGALRGSSIADRMRSKSFSKGRVFIYS